MHRPFGEQSEWLSPSQTAPETKGWIGERYDADAGLQYLNARYYDPILSMFLQPDWLEVTKRGVGTNRFSYSFNDPVNRLDPNGNQDAPSIMSKEEEEELKRKCARGCFSKNNDADMKRVWVIGAALAAPLVALEAAAFASVAYPSSYLMATEVGVAEATGMTADAGITAKAAPAALKSIDDLLGAGIKVTGTAQNTRGAGGMDHAMASTKAAIEEVNKLGGATAVDEVFFNTTLGKIVDGVSSGLRPDAAVKAEDGAVSIIEVASPSQTVQQMRDKIAQMSRMIGTINPDIGVSGWSKTVTDILRGH